MLTPQEIQQANQATGLNVPLNGKPAVTSRADQIRALAKKSTPANPINEDPAVTAGKSLFSSFKDRGQAQIDITKNTGSDISTGAQQEINGFKTGKPLDIIKGVGKQFRGTAEAGLQTAGNLAGAVGDIFGAGIKLMPGIEKKIQSAGQSFLESRNITGETNQETIARLSKAAEQHPHLAKDIESSINILTLGFGAEAEQPIKNAISNTAKDAVSTAKNVSTKISNSKGAIKEAFSPSFTVDEAAGRIAQGSIEDAPIVKKGIQNLSDTTGIKTHADIVKAVDRDIPKLAEAVDAEYAKDVTKHKIDWFTKNIGKGKSAVKVNYVKDGINQLKQFYTKTGNAKGLSDMIKLENKAKSYGGLTFKDINDLSRMHGSTLNAYNANGELASGLTKQAAENTRMGLKNTAREGLPTSEAKALDEKLSSLYDLKSIAESNAEKVNKLVQSTPKQGVVGKFTNKVIDVGATPLKYAAKKIGVGSEINSKLNPIELEKELSKHIETIRNEKIKH